MIQFTVLGIPVQQNGMTSVPTARGRRSITDGGVGIRAWRDTVAQAAQAITQEHPGSFPLDGPLELTVDFRFPMPKSRRKHDREHGLMWKTTTPDLDKLLRSIGDSLKCGGLVRDDALFVDIHVRKLETTGWIGADIQVTEAYPA